jgi:hypothetical protein
MACFVNTLRIADEIVLCLVREIFVAFFHPLPRIFLRGLFFIHAWLALGTGVSIRFGKMKRDVRFITDNPTVVRYRRYVEQLARAKLEHSAIIKCGGSGARQHQPNMFQMASRGANSRPDMLGLHSCHFLSIVNLRSIDCGFAFRLKRRCFS